MIVVDPQRPREITRHTEHPLSQAGREVQSRFDDALHVVVGQRTVRARVEHGDARDVHVHRRTLQVQEAGVEAGEAFGRHVIERTAAGLPEARGC